VSPRPQDGQDPNPEDDVQEPSTMKPQMSAICSSSFFSPACRRTRSATNGQVRHNRAIESLRGAGVCLTLMRSRRGNCCSAGCDRFPPCPRTSRRDRRGAALLLHRQLFVQLGLAWARLAAKGSVPLEDDGHAHVLRNACTALRHQPPSSMSISVSADVAWTCLHALRFWCDRAQSGRAVKSRLNKSSRMLNAQRLKKLHRPRTNH
jgi:hypothetical protein